MTHANFKPGQLIRAIYQAGSLLSHEDCYLLLELEPPNWQPNTPWKAWKVLIPNGRFGTVNVDPSVWEVVS